MDEIYKWGYNPLKDFLFQLILNDEDISDDEIHEAVVDNVIYILKYLGIEGDCLKNLDFEIKKKRDAYFKVVLHNIVTAMWFSGVFVNDCSFAINNDFITFEDKIFKFNKKTKKLTWKEKK